MKVSEEMLQSSKHLSLQQMTVSGQILSPDVLLTEEDTLVGR